MAAIEIDAQASARLDGLGDKLDKVASLQRAHLNLDLRKYTNMSGSIVGISSATAATVIPGPEGGKIWQIHRLSIGLPFGGSTPGTQGTILVGKSSGIQTQAQGSGQVVNPGNVSWIEVTRTTTVPSQIVWGRSQFWLPYPMNLVVLWASGTANAVLTLDVDALEYYAEVPLPTG
jgi:hypothetical protein